ncbi:hypothetical protein ANTRET_LOCUS7746 [Anthophora retusa]
MPFDVKRTTGYHKVHGKVSGKERSHEQGSLHVSARSLIKTGQRNKEARHAIGAWYRNETKTCRSFVRGGQTQRKLPFLPETLSSSFASFS